MLRPYRFHYHLQQSKLLFRLINRGLDNYFHHDQLSAAFCFLPLAVAAEFQTLNESDNFSDQEIYSQKLESFVSSLTVLSSIAVLFRSIEMSETVVIALKRIS